MPEVVETKNWRTTGIAIMDKNKRSGWSAVVFFGAAWLLCVSVAGQRSPSKVKRSVTVADVIATTRLADPSYLLSGAWKGPVGQFSPNGNHFLILLRKANLERDTNEFTLLL